LNAFPIFPELPASLIDRYCSGSAEQPGIYINASPNGGLDFNMGQYRRQFILISGTHTSLCPPPADQVWTTKSPLHLLTRGPCNIAYFLEIIQLVPEAGVEPARPLAGKRRILSPLCLPISPLRRMNTAVGRRKRFAL
jgi:hypothetical protein